MLSKQEISLSEHDLVQANELLEQAAVTLDTTKEEKSRLRQELFLSQRAELEAQTEMKLFTNQMESLQSVLELSASVEDLEGLEEVVSVVEQLRQSFDDDDDEAGFADMASSTPTVDRLVNAGGKTSGEVSSDNLGQRRGMTSF